MSSEVETGGEMVAVEMAAEAMQTTVLNVMMHIKRKLLEGREFDGKWYVTAASLAAVLKAREGGEKATVCRSHCSRGHGGCGSSCS